MINDTKILYLSMIGHFQLIVFEEVTYFYMNITECI